jgi:hypothetical protein
MNTYSHANLRTGTKADFEILFVSSRDG